MTMPEDIKSKCRIIIHSHAVAAAGGNVFPIPFLGVATDMVTMTSMALSLCDALGGNITEQTAKILAISSIKNTMLKQPIKIIGKELSKIVAPSMSVVMIEAAGWTLANELYKKSKENQL